MKGFVDEVVRLKYVR